MWIAHCAFSHRYKSCTLFRLSKGGLFNYFGLFFGPPRPPLWLILTPTCQQKSAGIALGAVPPYPPQGLWKANAVGGARVKKNRKVEKSKSEPKTQNAARALEKSKTQKVKKSAHEVEKSKSSATNSKSQKVNINSKSRKGNLNSKSQKVKKSKSHNFLTFWMFMPTFRLFDFSTVWVDVRFLTFRMRCTAFWVIDFASQLFDLLVRVSAVRLFDFSTFRVCCATCWFFDLLIMFVTVLLLAIRISYMTFELFGFSTLDLFCQVLAFRICCGPLWLFDLTFWLDLCLHSVSTRDSSVLTAAHTNALTANSW